LGWKFWQPDGARGAQPLTDQAAAAHDVPDQKRSKRGQGKEPGSEQHGDGSTQPRSGIWTLIKKLTQPASPRFT